MYNDKPADRVLLQLKIHEVFVQLQIIVERNVSTKKAMQRLMPELGRMLFKSYAISTKGDILQEDSIISEITTFRQDSMVYDTEFEHCKADHIPKYCKKTKWSLKQNITNVRLFMEAVNKEDWFNSNLVEEVC